MHVNKSVNKQSALFSRRVLLGKKCQILTVTPCFLVFSRRFSSEKCPTLTVASFFSFFFVRLQSHSDWATFLTIETTKTTTIRPSPVSDN